MIDKPNDLPLATSDCGCTDTESPCCGPSPEQLAASVNVIEFLPDKGKKPTPTQIDATIQFADRWGAFKSRWGVGRMNYVVNPGLYALGTPDENADVLITANYKLTFDKLRSALAGRNLWILVLNTFGINVWCAAGKGTFGTDELVKKVTDYNLEKLVSHRRLIVPQLGAPGVSGHEVKKKTGFRVKFGPIRAADIPTYLDNGRKTTPSMRRKDFPLIERIILIPVELVTTIKIVFLLQILFFFASGLGAKGGFIAGWMSSGILAVVALLASIVAGTILTPILLPYLPGRSFSAKCILPSLLLSVGVLAWLGSGVQTWFGSLEAGAWILINTALAAFMAMNFTGASTYTSLSGVRKEMSVAVPVQIATGAAGLCLWVGSRFLAG